MARRVGSPNYSGRVFQNQFRDSMQTAGAWVFRIPDSTYLLPGGKVGSSKTPADFLVVIPKGRVLHAALVECKAVGDKRLPFDRIADHQERSLEQLDSLHTRSHGFVAVNYYNAEDVREMNKLFMVPISVFKEYAANGDRKSLPLSTCEQDERIVECVRTKGSKWSMESFIESL